VNANASDLPRPPAQTLASVDGRPASLPTDRIVITGMGICSSIGNSVDEVLGNLRTATENSRPITRFDVTSFLTKLAAEVDLDPSILPDLEVRKHWDRGTQLAVVAARQALEQAGLLGAEDKPQSLVGVATGVSGSGQFQTAQADFKRELRLSREMAEVVFWKNTPNYQAEQLATYFQLCGPQTTVASASAGSGISIGIAVRWLQSLRCDAVLAGGAEALSVLNIIGFDVLGITAPGKNHPFSESNGMMMGEGAGYVTLERESRARERGVTILAYLDSFAVSADAFDPVLFDPTGNGQQRSMQRALHAAGIEPAQVDWLRASGSGGRDQDAAEMMAIGEVFGDSAPPITSLEPFFGHCNGAGPAMGMVAAIACMNDQLVPPTLNFSHDASHATRFDFVPNVSREAQVETTLCNSVAFGGTNVAIVCSRSGVAGRPRSVDEVVITGVGHLSALGAGGRDAWGPLTNHVTGIAPHDRFAMPADVAAVSGLVRGLKARKILPQVNLRGVDLLAQYAAIASSLAWNDAQFQPERHAADRLGIVCGLAHASGAVMERLMHEVYRDYRRSTVGKVMLRNGRFMVTSQLACWNALKGYNATLACGELSGANALLVAAEQLRHDDQLDAILVVASDEVSRFYVELNHALGLLVRDEGCMAPYQPISTGFIPGEGAVAVILERAEFAKRRSAPIMARLTGQAMRFDAPDSQDAQHESLADTIQAALREAQLAPADVGLVAGTGTGIWSHDTLEREGVARGLGTPLPLVSFAAHTGFMESAGSLFSTIAALSSLGATHPTHSTVAVDARGQLISSATASDPAEPRRPSAHALVVGQARAGHRLAFALAAPE
jgi:3-oxoacyl-[acyl-carrier-protein] synthase II